MNNQLVLGGAGADGAGMDMALMKEDACNSSEFQVRSLFGASGKQTFCIEGTLVETVTKEIGAHPELCETPSFVAFKNGEGPLAVVGEGLPFPLCYYFDKGELRGLAAAKKGQGDRARSDVVQFYLVKIVCVVPLDPFSDKWGVLEQTQRMLAIPSTLSREGLRLLLACEGLTVANSAEKARCKSASEHPAFTMSTTLGDEQKSSLHFKVSSVGRDIGVLVGLHLLGSKKGADLEVKTRLRRGDSESTKLLPLGGSVPVGCVNYTLNGFWELLNPPGVKQADVKTVFGALYVQDCDMFVGGGGQIPITRPVKAEFDPAISAAQRRSVVDNRVGVCMGGLQAVHAAAMSRRKALRICGGNIPLNIPDELLPLSHVVGADEGFMDVLQLAGVLTVDNMGTTMDKTSPAVSLFDARFGYVDTWEYVVAWIIILSLHCKRSCCVTDVVRSIFKGLGSDKEKKVAANWKLICCVVCVQRFVLAHVLESAEKPDECRIHFRMPCPPVVENMGLEDLLFGSACVIMKESSVAISDASLSDGRAVMECFTTEKLQSLASSYYGVVKKRSAVDNWSEVRGHFREFMRVMEPLKKAKASPSEGELIAQGILRRPDVI